MAHTGDREIDAAQKKVEKTEQQVSGLLAEAKASIAAKTDALKQTLASAADLPSARKHCDNALQAAKQTLDAAAEKNPEVAAKFAEIHASFKTTVDGLFDELGKKKAALRGKADAAVSWAGQQKDALQDDVKQRAEHVKDTAEHVKDSVKQRAEQVKDTVKERAEHVKDTVKDAASKPIDAVKNQAERINEQPRVRQFRRDFVAAWQKERSMLGAFIGIFVVTLTTFFGLARDILSPLFRCGDGLKSDLCSSWHEEDTYTGRICGATRVAKDHFFSVFSRARHQVPSGSRKTK